MIQSYYQIQREIKRINQWLLFNNQIQKIYSSSYYLNLVIRTPGKTKNLLIGRGAKGQGLWEIESQLPSSLRGKDHLLDYLRKHIIGMRLEAIELDQNDFIIRYNFLKNPTERTSLFLFYNRNETYMSYQYCVNGLWHCFGPVNTMITEVRPSFEIFESVGRSKNFYKFTESSGINISIEDIFKEESAEIIKTQNKKQKFLQKKIENIKADLEVFKMRHKVVELINSGGIEFDKLPQKTEILGIKIKFKSSHYFQRRDELYKKVKSLNNAEKILNARLSDCHLQMEKFNNKNYEETNEKLFKINWPTNKRASELVGEKSENKIEIKKFDGFIIGVGKDAGGNDYLRSRWGQKDDLWFHAEAGPSQHVVAKLIDEKKWDDLLREITNIFLPDGGDMNLVYTNLKNVKGIKGTKGLVEYKKEKHLRIIK